MVADTVASASASASACKLSFFFFWLHRTKKKKKMLKRNKAKQTVEATKKQCNGGFLEPGRERET